MSDIEDFSANFHFFFCKSIILLLFLVFLSSFRFEKMSTELVDPPLADQWYMDSDIDLPPELADVARLSAQARVAFIKKQDLKRQYTQLIEHSEWTAADIQVCWGSNSSFACRLTLNSSSKHCRSLLPFLWNMNYGHL
jgi:hypothetical protein